MRALLPRVRREDLLAALGVANLEVRSAAPASLLVEAAAAAACLPSLTGRSAEVTAARAAAVQSARAWFTGEELAQALTCSPRTVKRLRTAPVPPELIRAIALQLGLRLAKPPPESRLITPQAPRSGP